MMNSHNTENIDINSLKLIKPDMDYRASYIDADLENLKSHIYEFTPLTEEYRRSADLFKYYLEVLDCYERGEGLDSGCVPYSSYWLVDEKNKIFVGQSTLRHFLNDSLRTYGGHIGYCVRPSCWGKGYGAKQLELLLPEAEKRGLKSVRLTCFAENKPSARVMEKNGGQLVGKVYNRVSGIDRLTLIYEIKL